MSDKKVYRAIGLMSGTSLDGVDAALVETDGAAHVRALDFISVPYEEAQRAEIRKAFGCTDRADPVVRRAQEIVTQAHVGVLQKAGWQADVIGFHGQTIYHAPDRGLTIQIGDARAMADALGIDVVHDFRSADVAAGGQGAPLAPLYHAARVRGADVAQPCVILNIGGVANVTYIDGSIDASGDQIPACAGMTDFGDILAFDTGPGNALMDDWARRCTGQAYDKDGALAAVGAAVEGFVDGWMQHPYFQKPPPKSLDRDEWDIADLGRLVGEVEGFGAQDGAATLMEFTVRTIALAVDFMPRAPAVWYVCGGGRHNGELMRRLASRLPGRVADVAALGWDGDATEAECFAYLAVRSVLGLELSLPSTTGVRAPVTGGVLARARRG